MERMLQIIAERAEVSTATVSRVFSGKDYVSERTRDRILEIAKELNYTPKKYKKATACSPGQSTVAVMLPEIDNSFYCNILTGIQSILSQYSIDVIICCTNNCLGNELRTLNLLEQMHVQGLIAVPVSSSSKRGNTSSFRALRKKIPIVLLDRTLDGEDMDGVFMDDYGSAQKGTQLLVQNGHKNIAFITGSEGSSSATSRLKAFQNVMRVNNLIVNPDYILHGDFDADASYTAVKSLVQKELLIYNGHLKVTAFLSSSSKMLFGCLLALTECGLSTPDDVALLTFGETHLVRKNISFISYPSQEMGEECARILLNRIQNKSRAKKSASKKTIFDTTIELFGSEILPGTRI